MVIPGADAALRSMHAAYESLGETVDSIASGEADIPNAVVDLAKGKARLQASVFALKAAHGAAGLVVDLLV